MIDTIGGIVEYDLNTLSETRRWLIDALSITLSSTGDSLVFISDNNVYILDIISGKIPEKIITNPNPSEMWYSVAVSPFDNTLWVCNAKNYQINGEIEIYGFYGNTEMIKSYSVGVNPAKIVFY